MLSYELQIQARDELTEQANSLTEIRTKDGRERRSVAWILDEGFTGIYSIHARYKLKRVDVVRVDMVAGEDAGLIMIQRLEPDIGYVYYIAVARKHRHHGIGGTLLDDAIEMMKEEGMREVYAVRDEGNIGSQKLFESRQFETLEMNDFSERFGRRKAMSLKRRMTLVSGEVLLSRSLLTD